jgi:hypothetical protein
VTVDEYVAALRRRLWTRPLARKRILEEVEAHLRESAGEVGEEEAVRRFGTTAEVATGYAPDWALLGALAGLGGLVLAFGAGENLLPPAPWPSADAAPASVRVTGEAATWAAAAAALLLVVRRSTAAALFVGLAALLALASGLRRAWLYDALAVPGRLSWLEVVLGAAWLVTVAAVALVAAVARRASTS